MVSNDAGSYTLVKAEAAAGGAEGQPLQGYSSQRQLSTKVSGPTLAAGSTPGRRVESTASACEIHPLRIQKSQISKLKPDTLKTIDEIFCPLRSISRSTIAMLNWTHGLDSPPNPYGRSLAFYSEDGNRWLQFARATTGTFNAEEASRIVYARHVKVDEVVREVELGFEEPLGRQLFREAWRQIGVNPRGALVIGIAAAEVGLKRLIGTLIPGAEWLVQELQAPSVRKILRDFLPTLPVRARWVDGSEIKLPSKLIRKIEEAVKLRDKIVHVGALPPSGQKLATMLRSISDLLWICDVLLGEHWAMKHVSWETKKNWPSKSS
jgi:hypothetical protein